MFIIYYKLLVDTVLNVLQPNRTSIFSRGITRGSS